jgi:hypothetical protein
MTSEEILFDLKRAVLEYSLKHNLDTMVIALACHSKTRFTTYRLSPLRFDLYNMHLMVKNRQFDRFHTVIRFLAQFRSIAPPHTLPDKLYTRVTTSLKALVYCYFARKK